MVQFDNAGFKVQIFGAPSPYNLTISVIEQDSVLTVANRSAHIQCKTNLDWTYSFQRVFRFTSPLSSNSHDANRAR